MTGSNDDGIMALGGLRSTDVLMVIVSGCMVVWHGNAIAPRPLNRLPVPQRKLVDYNVVVRRLLTKVRQV
jgi:hypothetical protein